MDGEFLNELPGGRISPVRREDPWVDVRVVILDDRGVRARLMTGVAMLFRATDEAYLVELDIGGARGWFGGTDVRFRGDPVPVARPITGEEIRNRYPAPLRPGDGDWQVVEGDVFVRVMTRAGKSGLNFVALCGVPR